MSSINEYDLLNKMPESELKILFVLDKTSGSNAKVAKILRKHTPATHRDLKDLMSKKMVQRNTQKEYSITQKGRQCIINHVTQSIYYAGLNDWVNLLVSEPQEFKIRD